MTRSASEAMAVWRYINENIIIIIINIRHVNSSTTSYNYMQGLQVQFSPKEKLANFGDVAKSFVRATPGTSTSRYDQQTNYA